MGILDDLGITVVSDASMLQQSQVRAVRAHIAARASALPAGEFAVPAPEPAPVPVQNNPSDISAASAATVSTNNGNTETSQDFEWAAALSAARRPILLWGPPGSGKSTF